MPQTFKHDGVIYEDLGNGNVRVVGYDNAPSAQGRVFSLPKDPLKDATQQAQLDKLRLDMSQTQATNAAEQQKTVAQAGTAAFTAANQQSNQNFDRAGKLRNDYQQLPSVKNYTQALPAYAAGLQSKANPAGDQDLIYAYAKIMDPNSVVREREQASVANADSMINSITARLKNQLDRTGQFTPQYRLELRQEMARRMAELNRQFIADRVNYKENSLRNGVDPLDVVGRHPGEMFRPITERVFGRKEGQLDFYGRPVQADDGSNGDSGPAPIGPLATGGTKLDRNPEREKALDALLRSGASNDTINATSKAMGGMDIDGAKLDAMRDAVKKGYKGPTFDSSVAAPTTLWNRLSASPVASAVIGAGNGLTGGAADEVLGGIDSLVTGRPLSQSIPAMDDRKQALANENWKSSLVGNAAGSLAGFMGLGAGARAAGLTASLGKYAPYIGAAAYGGATGALENNKDRLTGAGIGALAGVGGQAAGDLLSIPVGAAVRSQPVQRVLGLFGQQRATAPALAPADAMIANAASKAGVADIRSQLAEAQNLGLPMTLADTHPELRELTGAAVRRSPTASAIAENTLLPRNRGQIDRLGQAVTRDLGPTANIPQMAADMTEQARIAAGPLYDRAYAQPVVSTPEIQSTLNTPFGRQALSRANTIAANERRNPMELGFAQDEAGNVVLNPRPNQAIANHLAARAELDAAQEAYRAAKNQPGTMDAARNRLTAARDGLRKAEFALNQAPDPSLPANVPGYTTQTLDYVKRGMDDVLEQQRNPITGRLVLDEAGRAQNQVRSQFLNEVDRINPAYGAARNAYAGPVQARDALARGQDAFSLNPDELAMQVGTQSPEHLAQMQLGYRDQLMKQGNNVRYSTNPFEATLGTPAAEQRLSTLYGNTPGVSQLLRQRDLERSMQQTSNAVLGNSKTAQRQIADEGFLENPMTQAGIDIGASVLAGGMPVTTMLRAMAGNYVRDARKFGVGKLAVAKADAIAPSLLNINPAQNLTKIDELIAAQDAYQRLVEATRPKRLGMMFSGGSVGAANQIGR
ncbi:hypothetical protein [Sphingomonas beigongshangi]|uniref:hypothetical protein n=1 Tax=Sphingomonas beigongshangi TaxID=2782540 RepID=UPI00193B0C83|nr:hypothetical protein [Sphingomonas beigongshangi]